MNNFIVINEKGAIVYIPRGYDYTEEEITNFLLANERISKR